MNLHAMSVQLMISITIILAATKLTTAVTQPGRDCQTTCGDVSNITFPFGMSPDCYLDDTFLITCDKTFQPPQPFLWESNLQVLSILPEVGELRILHRVSRFCFNSSGYINWSRSKIWRTRMKDFSISYTRNKFTSVGCATTAFIYGPDYTTGCISDCSQTEHVVNGSCTGMGCCEARIPRGVHRLNFRHKSLGNHSSVYGFNPCSYFFVVEDGNYSFNSLDLWNLSGHDQFPVVLDWAVGTVACPNAKQDESSYMCRSSNSECVNSTNGPGYRCNCSSGFQGNPYLYHGCQDIDECEENPNICGDGSICSNSPPGNYSCSCKKGYHKDGGICRKKSQKFTWQTVSLGVSISLLLLVMGSSWIYLILKKRKLMKQRELFFKKNGGFMLKQQLSKQVGSVEKARVFTVEDLKRATNNYDEIRIIGQGGYGTVYKGVLLDDREVAIKKSKISEQSQIEQFINEMVILSEINHVNVVKLIGCCLETEVPLLVYEFIPNGTLSDHIHNESRASSLSWEMRLKIAAESAGAIAYIHYAISTPIIHRDIKSTNILLDNNYTAKVSDFGASRLVPVNQTQLTTLVQGTFGYLDPEYFHSSQLTKKSDVYSFGVVLAELLTGKEALSFDRPDKERNLATYFALSMKDDRFVEILDDKLVKEANIEQLKEVAMLVTRCLTVKGEERPTMKEVASELEGIRVANKHSWTAANFNIEESEKLLSQSVPWEDGNDYDTTRGYDSMRERMLGSLESRS
ncbi:hypothetical protein LguiB_017765 [Lonicera macranthoides]